jgi:hypothetical protein
MLRLYISDSGSHYHIKGSLIRKLKIGQNINDFRTTRIGFIEMSPNEVKQIAPLDSISLNKLFTQTIPPEEIGNDYKSKTLIYTSNGRLYNSSLITSVIDI